MKTRILLVCLLLVVFSSRVRCRILTVIEEENRNCIFILSNGDYEEFITAVPLFENCTRQIKNANLVVKLSNYTLPGFPNGTFTNLPYLNSFKLEISKGSQIHTLSPLLPEYFVFKNVKFESAVFNISHSPNLIGWKWEALSDFGNKPIKKFVFNAVRSKIIYLNSTFGVVGNKQLTTVRILKCQLRWLGENVFGPFSNLLQLELRDNLIEKFERLHLPRNATQLHTLDLGKNRLQHISSDLFTDFQLKNIFLDGNNIKMLSKQVETILSSVSPLEHIYGDYLWPCDCSKIKQLTGKFKNILGEKCYTTEKDINIEDFMKESCAVKPLLNEKMLQ